MDEKTIILEQERLEKAKKRKKYKKFKWAIFILILILVIAGVWYIGWGQYILDNQEDDTVKIVAKADQNVVYAKITAINGNEITYAIAEKMDIDMPQESGDEATDKGEMKQSDETGRGNGGGRGQRGDETTSEASSGFPMKDASENSQSDVIDSEGGRMPDMGNMGEGGQMPDMSSMGEGGQMPDMGSMGEGGQMPDMSSMGEGGQMPDMGNMGEGGQMPDMSSMGEGGQMPDMSSMGEGGQMPDMSSISEGIGQSDLREMLEGIDTEQMAEMLENIDMSQMSDMGNMSGRGGRGDMGGMGNNMGNMFQMGGMTQGNTASATDTNMFTYGDSVYMVGEETVTTYIPVGTDVTTKLGTVTTFSRLSAGDCVAIVTEKDGNEAVIMAVYIIG